MVQLVERIRDNPFFLVLENAGEIIGCSSAYTERDLRDLDFEKDQIAQHILSKSSNFVYWDQIGIINQFQNRIAAGRLMDAFLQDSNLHDYSSVWGAVCHFPRKNNQAIRLAQAKKFELEEEISAYNGLIFGIYRRQI